VGEAEFDIDYYETSQKPKTLLSFDLHKQCTQPRVAETVSLPAETRDEYASLN
jgi:hypothetical protein